MPVHIILKNTFGNSQLRHSLVSFSLWHQFFKLRAGSGGCAIALPNWTLCARPGIEPSICHLVHFLHKMSGLSAALFVKRSLRFDPNAGLSNRLKFHDARLQLILADLAPHPSSAVS